MSRERAKPVRIIPPVTDATLRRAEEALRWHEARAKRKARAS